MYPDIWLLDLMVILYLIPWGSAILLSIIPYQFIFPTMLRVLKGPYFTFVKYISTLKRKQNENSHLQSLFISDTFRLPIFPTVIKQMKMSLKVNLSMLFSVDTYDLLYGQSLPRIWSMISNKSHRLTETLRDMFLL